MFHAAYFKIYEKWKICYTTIIFIFHSEKRLLNHGKYFNPVSFHILSQDLCISYCKHGRPTQTNERPNDQYISCQDFD